MMGIHQLKILKFAIQYHGGWHFYEKDRNTVRAVMSLAKLQLIRLNDNHQFTLNKSPQFSGCKICKR